MLKTLTFGPRKKFHEITSKRSNSYIQEKWCRNNRRKEFSWGNLGERDHLEDPSIDGKNIKMDLREVGCGGMDWIDLA